MASQTHLTVKILEKCEVSPPPHSVPSTFIPLSFSDLPWFYCQPIQRIFFYEFPHPTQHFLQTLLPSLKHSLSLTLQHFFPFAAVLIFPPRPNLPYIHYTDGNSVPFTVAESAADFTRLVADSPKDVRDLHPFVPSLPSPRTLRDGTRLIPLMAIQVTVLANSGFSICFSFNHVAADGRAFHHFVKFWASVCSKKGSLILPFHNRNIIEDPKGIKQIYLEKLWDSLSENIIFNGIVRDACFADKIRATLVLSRDQIEKLKKWIFVQQKSKSLEKLHLSTFVVTCSLIWVCMVDSEETKVNDVEDNDEPYHLVFLADCSNRPEISVPCTYFGNCLDIRILGLKRSRLVGENGILEAVNAIESDIRDFKRKPLEKCETLMSELRELRESHVLAIAGSPKLDAYETDFGWGKPKKSEVIHIDISGSVSLSDSRDTEGGIEVGLALGRVRMNNFNAIFERYITNMDI